MAGRADSSRRHRVVALLPAGRALEVNGSVNLVRTNSGYEAAAELLSGPASALLVNLARLTAAHIALLNLARKLEVPVVAFGVISTALDGSALAGVRLVGPEQVAETLGNIVAAVPKDGPPARADVEESEAYQAILSGPDSERAGKPRQPLRPGKPDARPPQRDAEILTQEELDRLLRD